MQRIPALVVLVAWPALATGQRNDPVPQDAATAIVAAFGKYEVVGMSAAHSDKMLDDFLLSLVRSGRLAGKVNDIVIECGNRKYQDALDRYIAGEPVPLADVRPAWRNTTAAMCGMSGFTEALLIAIREMNLRTPPADRVRVLAADPPVDWSTGDALTIRRSANRDASITSVMMTEVLPKHRKALMLIGVGHLYHAEASGGVVTTYERTYPGVTFIIQTHNGFAAVADLPRGRQLEARMSAWTRPSLVRIRGTWLADLDLPYYMWPFPKGMAGESIADLVDAYLYLGPGDSLTYEPTPAGILDDTAHVATMAKRFGVSVDRARKRNAYQWLYTASDYSEAHQFAPGSRLVSWYGRSPADSQPAVDIDFRAGKLSVRVAPSPSWAAMIMDRDSTRYRAEAPYQDMVFEFDMAGGMATGLTVQSTPGSTTQRLIPIPMHFR